MDISKKEAHTDSGGSIRERCITEDGLFHYVLSGLNNVFLKGGFTISNDGMSFSIDNVMELHDCIAMALINGTHDLSGKELKFLRKELSLTQSQVAKLIGADVQAIARWEKGKNRNPIAGRLVKVLYMSIKHPEDRVGDIDDFLKNTSDLDIIEHKQWLFEQNTQWHSCAA